MVFAGILVGSFEFSFQVGLRLEGDICKLISDVPGHSENFKGWGELRPYTVPRCSKVMLPIQSFGVFGKPLDMRFCKCISTSESQMRSQVDFLV